MINTILEKKNQNESEKDKNNSLVLKDENDEDSIYKNIEYEDEHGHNE